ncbi:MAG: hypothetical protein ABS81_02475 [Pseudonocardia sp. SCN 72-86]|nr:MAG: hypothetical protein ABS81_02475 [Pseudonocardia sp. SCN 72-86]
MTFVIGAACIDVLDRSCIEVCPVDCIYEGSRKLYINPRECIDCGACEPECPVSAITTARDVLDGDVAFVADSEAFFAETLPGRAAPLGAPGGAADTPVGVDTAMVAGWPVAGAATGRS